MCYLDSDDPVDAYAEEPRIARKEHSCIGCGATIHKGEAYCRVFYVADGRGTAEKECFACWWTRKEFWEEHSGGPLPWALEEYLRECIGGEHSNPWRPHLAALKRRRRISSPRLRALHSGWIHSAIQRQFQLTRRVIRSRTT